MLGIARSMFRPLAGFALSVALGLATSAAYADELLAPPSTGAKIPFSLGAAVIYKEKPYRNYDDDEKVQLAPLIVYQGERFFFRGTNFGWMFVNRPNIEFAILGEIRNDGYDSGDANILQGMDDRDPTLDGGARFTWRPADRQRIGWPRCRCRLAFGAGFADYGPELADSGPGRPKPDPRYFRR